MDVKEQCDENYRKFEILVDCLTRKNVINANEAQALLNGRVPE